MKIHNLKKFDVGQDLIDLTDDISNKERDFSESYPKVAEVLHRARMNIGFRFNKLKSHDFRLQDYTTCTCPKCFNRRNS